MMAEVQMPEEHIFTMEEAVLTIQPMCSSPERRQEISSEYQFQAKAAGAAEVSKRVPEDYPCRFP